MRDQPFISNNADRHSETITMPFSHHSHSGQFCPGHAKDSLEEVIQTAIEKKMQVFCLTEHMPRHEVDFYPEEVPIPPQAPSSHHSNNPSRSKPAKQKPGTKATKQPTGKKHSDSVQNTPPKSRS